jgi:hypothetical protein
VVSAHSDSECKGVTVQRAKDFGLRESKKETPFAGAALAYLAANGAQAPSDYVNYLVSNANDALIAEGIPPFVPPTIIGPIKGTTGATFSASDWGIAVDLTKTLTHQAARVSDLTIDDAAELADSIYHETRHAEQNFRVAQVLSSTEHKKAEQIAEEQLIPLAIARKAVASSKTAPANPAIAATIESWRATSRGGRHKDFRDLIVDIEDELLAAVERMPALPRDPKSPLYGPFLSWASELIDVAINDWYTRVQTFVDKKSPTLKKGTLDDDIHDKMGGILLSITRASQAARKLREAKGANAIPERVFYLALDFADTIMKAHLDFNRASTSLPKEVDAYQAGHDVKHLMGLMFMAEMTL